MRIFFLRSIIPADIIRQIKRKECCNMKKISIIIVMNLFIFLGLAFGESDRYVHQHKLSTGETAVIAEGDFEPRSMGSYSIRIYSANPDFPTDVFLCGTIRSRDGSIEKVMIQDINGDKTEEIVVIIRSVGTGEYLSADAFLYQSKQLKVIANVSNLEKSTDPIHTLKKIIQKNVK